MLLVATATLFSFAARATRITVAVLAAVAVLTGVAVAVASAAGAQGTEQMRPPTADVPDTRDAAALPRYRGATLLESSSVEFDEVAIPRGPLVKTGQTDGQHNTVYADCTPLKSV
jgi:hypothetical protein